MRLACNLLFESRVKKPWFLRADIGPIVGPGQMPEYLTNDPGSLFAFDAEFPSTFESRIHTAEYVRDQSPGAMSDADAETISDDLWQDCGWNAILSQLFNALWSLHQRASPYPSLCSHQPLNVLVDSNFNRDTQS